MSTFKMWLLLLVVAVALLHSFAGGIADVLGGRLVISSSHGWNEAIVYMLLAVVVAIAVK